jgi:hypothetical protein
VDAAAPLKINPVRNIITILAALPLFAGSAFGWGCQGHQVIALIARTHLTPAASTAVDKLLSENPIDPALSRFCRVHPADLLADSATWADDERNVIKNDGWHYVDIPLSVTSGDAMEWCPPKTGCIITALANALDYLRSKSQSDVKRAEALRYVVHLISDMTQPLHAEDDHDQGGNCETVSLPSAERPTNLHSLWDSGLLAQEVSNKKLTDEQLVSEIDHEFSDKFSAWSKAPVDPQAWAWESHEMAVKVIYGNLRPQIPLAPFNAGDATKESCDAEKASSAALHITIGSEYSDAALPVIHAQMAKAAYRTAGILNEIFK